MSDNGVGTKKPLYYDILNNIRIIYANLENTPQQNITAYKNLNVGFNVMATPSNLAN